MNHIPGSDHKRITVTGLAVVAALAILLSACGVDSDSVTTVDSAVTLLQDLDNSGVWTKLSDGFDVLDDYDGYLALATLHTGLLDAEGNITTEPDQIITIAIHVDADGAAQYTITQAEQAQQVITLPTNSASDASDTSTPFLIVEKTDDGYICADQATTALFAVGPQSMFEAYGVKRASLATLSVANEDGESILIERETTHYQIESRLADALDILDDTGNDTLREQVQQADGYSLTGTFDLDNDSGALLYFEGTHSDSTAQNWGTLVFEVTQWGDVPTLEFPSDDLLPACD